MWNAMFVYLHHLCLIFLAGTDFVFRWPSSMRSWGDTSTTTPQRGAKQMKGGMLCIHPAREHEECSPVQEETVTPYGEGSSSRWESGPSASGWENPRTSVYAPNFPYDPWTHQYYPGAGGSSGPQ